MDNARVRSLAATAIQLHEHVIGHSVRWQRHVARIYKVCLVSSFLIPISHYYVFHDRLQKCFDCQDRCRNPSRPPLRHRCQDNEFRARFTRPFFAWGYCDRYRKCFNLAVKYLLIIAEIRGHHQQRGEGPPARIPSNHLIRCGRVRIQFCCKSRCSLRQCQHWTYYRGRLADRST